jgi:hypothetical protein
MVQRGPEELAAAGSRRLTPVKRVRHCVKTKLRFILESAPELRERYSRRAVPPPCDLQTYGPSCTLDELREKLSSQW